MKENEEKVHILPAGDKPVQGGVDPLSIILPNIEVHSPLNAQRVSAGTLYAQETSATLPKVPAPAPLSIVPTHNSDTVQPLETYQSDVEKYIRTQNISPVKAVAAEQIHRQQTAQPIEVTQRAPQGTSVALHTLAIVCSVLLIIGAGGAFVYSYMQSRPTAQKQNPTAPFITVDSTIDISITSDNSREITMQKFVDAASNTHLSVGLISQLQPWIASSAGTRPIPAQPFLSVLTPRIPSELLRTIRPEFLIGVHSFDTNQLFLIFSVDSYEGAYAGMLEWEPMMQSDLSPLFSYTPPQRVLSEISKDSTTTKIILSPFVDTIVENHDTRAIKNSSGDTLLLWTFIDRSTVLVTTNAHTVREVLSRLKTAPQLTVPK